MKFISFKEWILESLNFERGIDPKKSMDIGVNSIDWGLPDYYNIEDFIKDFEGFSILIISYDFPDFPQSKRKFLGITNKSKINDSVIIGGWQGSKEEALKDIKSSITKYKKLTEL